VTESAVRGPQPLWGRLRTRSFELADWQREAVRAWERGDGRGDHRGTLEIFTGGGKTLIALACCEAAARAEDGLSVAIVVPTEALAHQWRQVVERFTTVPRERIGLLGAGRRDSLRTHQVLVCVLNTARDNLVEMARDVDPLMLIVDECHRAGSPENSRVLRTTARYRLGLSATPEREEVDESGQPIEYSEQVLGRELGDVCFRFTLGDAREVGWLPSYRLFHHAVHLWPEERAAYDQLSRQIDDVSKRLRELGVPTGRAIQLGRRDPELSKLAARWTTLTSQRKDLLFRVSERRRVAGQVLRDLVHRLPNGRILVFNERVEEAERLFEDLRATLPTVPTALEHSLLPTKARNEAIQRFRDGRASLLVSVKALIEGLDVPEIDGCVAVASTSSVRQRIQSLGRALRRRRSAGDDVREIHLLYVADSADEEIYAKEDWRDLTGRDSDTYLEWELGANTPHRTLGPPRMPRPTEEQEWNRFGRRVPQEPEEWLGAWPEAEYSVDVHGNVTTPIGRVVTNPQGIARMIERVRGRPGARFRVTPVHRLVLVTGEGHLRDRLFLAGRLQERLEFQEVGEDQAVPNATSLSAGSPYPGPATDDRGTFRITRRGGGQIERRTGRGNREFAFDEGGVAPELEENARRLLDAWRSLDQAPTRFSINAGWHAWYREEGRPYFLTEVKGGFRWPSEMEERT
jgi:superfamily II DNA or RNA helicase